MKTYANFTECYFDLIRSLRDEPQFIAAPRGQRVAERLCESFTIEDPRARVPFISARDLSISYAIAETLWYISANDSMEWIANYSAFWRGISDDGVTSNSAYGARIFRTMHSRVAGPRELSQWDAVKRELQRDPDSRRAVIHVRSPHDTYDALKDVPCTLTLQFFIRDGKLHLVVTMRSNDVVLGVPYDVFAFTFMQELMANELELPLGSYMHTANSLHLYERDFEMADAILATGHGETKNGELIGPMPQLPNARPPISALLLAEKDLHSVSSARDIVKIVKSAENIESSGFWHDWVKVLASHRAGKLKLNSLRRGLLDSTRWSGYGFFKR